MNGSITSSGKPCGYVGNAVGVTTPISSQWPVVVSLPFERSSSRPATAGAPGCGGQPSSGIDVAEAERLEVGQVETADGAGDVAERVRALVPVLGCVRQLSGADGVEHDHARPRHGGYSTAALDTVLGLLVLVVYIAAILGSRRAITYAVIKIFPSRAERRRSRTSRTRSRRRARQRRGSSSAARSAKPSCESR